MLVKCCTAVELIQPAQLRVQYRAPVNTVTNIRVTQKTENLLTSSPTVSLSTRALLHRASKFHYLKSAATEATSSLCMIYKYPFPALDMAASLNSIPH